MKQLIDLLESYKPYNEQEERDKASFIQFLSRNDDALHRSNLAGHVTSSAIVVNPEMTKILFAFHNIYQSWSWVGGHNDGDIDPLFVAQKETKEETGIKTVYPYSEDIFMIDVVHVTNHIKKGVFVPDHLHYNITYLLIADEAQELTIQEEENSGVKWFSLESLFDHVDEERMIPIYQKAIEKINMIKRDLYEEN